MLNALKNKPIDYRYDGRGKKKPIGSSGVIIILDPLPTTGGKAGANKRGTV